MGEDSFVVLLAGALYDKMARALGSCSQEQVDYSQRVSSKTALHVEHLLDITRPGLFLHWHGQYHSRCRCTLVCSDQSAFRVNLSVSPRCNAWVSLLLVGSKTRSSCVFQTGVCTAVLPQPLACWDCRVFIHRLYFSALEKD